MIKSLVAELNETPAQSKYDFRKGVMKTETGETIRDIKGKPVMERTILAALKEQVENQYRNIYGENWKWHFNHFSSLS